MLDKDVWTHKTRFVDCIWNVMAHGQKPDFVFRRNGRLHLNRPGGGGRGRRFSRLLPAEVCPSAVVTLDTPCSEIVWRVLAIHSIRQFPLHFPDRASPCANTFQLEFICQCVPTTECILFAVHRSLPLRLSQVPWTMCWFYTGAADGVSTNDRSNIRLIWTCVLYIQPYVLHRFHQHNPIHFKPLTISTVYL